jgi:hypothetical protein
MNTKARNMTLFGIAAGLIMVPIVRAVIRRYGKKSDAPTPFDTIPPNRIFSAYRGKHKPHHRKTTDNGVH